ncbi:hypothetical protein [Streptomyces hydrogenans]|uniref:hypothetical protein n=1 Tax=Streptomyces hydrogenans TaxID=1873719 RepID=UPI0036EB0E0A
MTTEAAVGIVVIPEPTPVPPLEVVPDPPAPAPAVAEIAAGVTAALIEAWDMIRVCHPEVPEAVISMATGGRASSIELAHFAPRRWRMREGGALHHEVFVTAEALEDGAEKVLAYLLHEAAHAWNEAAGVNDCSASQYHNKHFRERADDLGLKEREGIDPKWRKKYGFAGYSELNERGAKLYADQITALERAMHATRRREVSTSVGQGSGRSTGGTATAADAGGDALDQDDAPVMEKKKEERNYIKAVCACETPTVIRVSPKTLERRKIMCGDCAAAFTRES